MAIVPVCDFPARGSPYSLVGKDILQRFVQIFDPERQSNHEWVQWDAHYPPTFFSFPIKRVELVTKHLVVFSGSVVAAHEHTDIVEPLVIRHYQHSPLAHAHGCGLVIAHPVTDIFEAFTCQEIRCLKALCERRPEPSLRSCPNGLGDRVLHLPDHLDLLIFGVARETEVVCNTVAEPLPIALL